MVEKFRVHTHLTTDLHQMNEIDPFVLVSINELHLLNRSLASEFFIELVKAARKEARVGFKHHCEQRAIL